jgi:hypothetical protein
MDIEHFPSSALELAPWIRFMDRFGYELKLPLKGTLE